MANTLVTKSVPARIDGLKTVARNEVEEETYKRKILVALKAYKIFQA